MVWKGATRRVARREVETMFWEDRRGLIWLRQVFYGRHLARRSRESFRDQRDAYRTLSAGRVVWGEWYRSSEDCHA